MEVQLGIDTSSKGYLMINGAGLWCRASRGAGSFSSQVRDRKEEGGKITARFNYHAERALCKGKASDWMWISPIPLGDRVGLQSLGRMESQWIGPESANRHWVSVRHPPPLAPQVPVHEDSQLRLLFTCFSFCCFLEMGLMSGSCQTH